MRVTIEIKPEHRRALQALAAGRGQKGFSLVLAEAIQVYLDGQRDRDLRRKKFLSLAGSLSAKEGRLLHTDVRRIRKNWR